MEARFCPNCGMRVDPGATRCARCGAEVRMPVPPAYEDDGGVHHYGSYMPPPGVSYGPVSSRYSPGYSHVTAPSVTGERPTAAFVLGVMAAIFIILNGLVFAAIGGFIASVFAEGALIGGAGIVIGMGVLVMAFLLSHDTRRNVPLGGAMLALSLLSIVIGGGFLIGLVLGAVAGIAAMVWRP